MKQYQIFCCEWRGDKGRTIFTDYAKGLSAARRLVREKAVPGDNVKLCWNNNAKCFWAIVHDKATGAWRDYFCGEYGKGGIRV